MQGALKMRPASGNDLKTVLLHRTAFLCVSRFLRLASFGTVNALMIAISVTFQPLFSVIPKICRNFVYYLIIGDKIMARPIAETPILTGDDAVRFEKLRIEVENLSKEQRADNTRKLQEAVKKAKEYITICI